MDRLPPGLVVDPVMLEAAIELDAQPSLAGIAAIQDAVSAVEPMARIVCVDGRVCCVPGPGKRSALHGAIVATAMRWGMRRKTLGQTPITQDIEAQTASVSVFPSRETS